MAENLINIPEDEDKERAKRISEEWLSVESALDKANVLHTIVFFGSARIDDAYGAALSKDKADQLSSEQPHNHVAKWAQMSASLSKQQSQYYEDARQLAKAIGQYLYTCKYQTTKMITGGGPGIMEAANRGASEIGQPSIGLNINIPKEQIPNPYIHEELSFSFHYFSLRKMHFLKRARVIIVFPGGFGTMDELMEALTLMQTGKMPTIPILLYGNDFWKQAINFEFLAEQRLIDEDDLKLIEHVNDVDSALARVTSIIKCEQP
ncbi:TIGR00730 family Rossman fold protein [Aliikangiella marina]|uniref:Cytokinin riboside 5'-monophosphate phosphoribohydrolase n=1 Tax=Aliikangiella marina TaxID=1712262 RepID=A0A545TH76_9GAMM|nr:TIGR00730 family Rossman fold protein [Aliikangiella marina]TQV76548.1 TIGR00730 family Rossman fold protein [Aliikangiella marina]